MTHYFFIKLSEKVKECNQNQITDFGFDDVDFSNVEFQSAWFNIHSMPLVEDYGVSIHENGNVYLIQGDQKLFPISGEDAKNWKELAMDIFRIKFESEIEDAEMQDTLERQYDYADMQRKANRENAIFNL